MGILPDIFWSMTLRELFVMWDGFMKRYGPPKPKPFEFDHFIESGT
jgi:hypothetical protein